MMLLLAQTTQGAFKVVMPFTAGDFLRTFVSLWWKILGQMPWWCWLIIILVIVARLVFGPLGK